MSMTTTLTTRELEVLHWSSQGKTDGEVGAILAISARTARFHMENAKRKLGAVTKAQAVALAIRAGLLEERVA